MPPINKMSKLEDPSIQTSASADGAADKDANGDDSWRDGLEEDLSVVDAAGHSLTLTYLPDGKGCKYVSRPFIAESILKMPSFRLRDDDLLIASFPKTGCHWMWDILRMLQRGELVLDSEKKEESMMEHETIEDLDQLPSPRILNNHQFFDRQPRDIFKSKSKIIFLYRNIKDVMTSFWFMKKNLYAGTYREFIQRTAEGLSSFGSPFEYYQSWDKGIREHPELPIFVCSFEDLKMDPIPVLQSLGKFIGAARTDEAFLREILDATNIDKMRERKSQAFDEKKRGMVSLMYRKGLIGDWKNLLTVADDEWISKLIEEKLKDTQFKMVYE